MGNSLSFYLSCSLPFTLMGRFGFTIFEIGYLEKGDMWGKRDLEEGSTKKFFWVIFIFKQAI
jgi:hypothetical protein